MPTIAARGRGYGLSRLLDRIDYVAFLRARIDAPVVTGLPFGHVARKLTLPVGARAELSVTDSAATLAWRLR